MEEQTQTAGPDTRPSEVREEAGCHPMEKRLSASLDVDITLDEIEELKTHLQGCPPCLEFVESLKATVRLCKDFGIEQTPAPLAEDTRRKMVAAYQKMLAKRGVAPA